MSDEDRRHALIRQALGPGASVVIEACAGSGKTWMLVSRIIRLLLTGVAPAQILAITFTRKAAQEMAARLRDWLRDLATADDEKVREFLRERAVPAGEIDGLAPKARLLYEEFLTAQPSVTIATFHSWYLQLLRRAPLDAEVPGEFNLVEQTSALVDEAWELFAGGIQRDPVRAAALDNLFRGWGDFNTRRSLTSFLHRRADWWAYTRGQDDPAAYALARIREEMRVAPEADVIGELFSGAFRRDLAEYTGLLARNTAGDKEAAHALSVDEAGKRRFEILRGVVLREDGTARARVSNATQIRRLGAAGDARFVELHARLGAQVQEACGRLAEQASYRFNEAALPCGVALLEAYQRVKAERQVLDYADVEWEAWRLVSVSDHAAYMQYKLDTRYRHILLDEFQDTNPLQWLTLRSWLEAAAAADLRPTVFMVGDPKQSIYRFRRAEARLFTRAAAYLNEGYGARTLPQDETRRCPRPVVEIVNRLFRDESAFTGFDEHAAHYAAKPGRVEILPLVRGTDAAAGQASDGKALRNPLERPLTDVEDRRREDEAGLLVKGIEAIVGRWRIATDPRGDRTRVAEYRDIMILVRRRTHLAIYEKALGHAAIPFITSRQGGLLDTLEAQDIVALLEFLVSPFADLKLAHALRSPVFAATDDDLATLAAAGGKTWWERLQRVAGSGTSPALDRAHFLLARWLARTDSAPVHDQLDRIYFEADVLARYRQAVPRAMRDAVHANLQAFMQRALDSDSGRYPSLPRFLHELTDLREAPVEEAPDEGIVGDAGNAVRIYTVHGAKGLEAPVVWLLDAAAGVDPAPAYYPLVDWPPEEATPRRFSLCSVKSEQSAAQRAVVDEERALAERENLNLLYVGMTRAQQALIVSGAEGRGREGSWYEKVRAAVLAVSGQADDPDSRLVHGSDLAQSPAAAPSVTARGDKAAAPAVDSRLTEPLPTGERRTVLAGRGLTYGTNFHLLMERLTEGGPADREAVRAHLALTERDFAPMWNQAQGLLAAPALTRFFDSRQFRRAVNEVAYTAEAGEVRRIDRLVEFENEVWVLDYKTGENPDDVVLAEQYRAQLGEYCASVRAIFPGKAVRGLLLFSGGEVLEA
jgi:ATP-dependent helicase/nuclease subunit A